MQLNCMKLKLSLHKITSIKVVIVWIVVYMEVNSFKPQY